MKTPAFGHDEESPEYRRVLIVNEQRSQRDPVYVPIKIVKNEPDEVRRKLEALRHEAAGLVRHLEAVLQEMGQLD